MSVSVLLVASLVRNSSSVNYFICEWNQKACVQTALFFEKCVCQHVHDQFMFTVVSHGSFCASRCVLLLSSRSGHSQDGLSCTRNSRKYTLFGASFLHGSDFTLLAYHNASCANAPRCLLPPCTVPGRTFLGGTPCRNPQDLTPALRALSRASQWLTSSL